MEELKGTVENERYLYQLETNEASSSLDFGDEYEVKTNRKKMDEMALKQGRAGMLPLF